MNEPPLAWRRVVVRLRGRRYFCDRKRCSRKTFVEQVPGLTERHRRSSVGLTGWLRSIAVELGGRPAVRLCRRLRPAAGRTRLLQPLTAPPVPGRAPRVLGVDEFAFRKGCTYGTILVDVDVDVDVEAGQVVDVLPDRTSETFAAWLKEHPGAEIICRDRATAYTKTVKGSRPQRPRSRRPLASASEPVRRSGEDLPPAPQLPAQTRRAGVGADRAGTGPTGIARAGTAPH
ncbi:transposase [Streptomyces mirabilis]